MKSRKPAVGTVFLACVSAGLLGFAAPAAAASAPTAKTASAAGTFVKAFAAVVSKSQVNVYPGDVQATSDGGSIALSETETAKGLGVDWLVKLSAAGAPQWHEEVGCASSKGAPDDYADGVSVQQTPGGGYIVGCGTIDCGSGSTCPPLSGQSCALVEKLSSSGKLTWARAYAAGPDGSAINQIRPTADGGYVAAGSVTESSGEPGAMILKLDSSGHVQWQQDLGPGGGAPRGRFSTPSSRPPSAATSRRATTTCPTAGESRRGRCWWPGSARPGALAGSMASLPSAMAQPPATPTPPRPSRPQTAATPSSVAGPTPRSMAGTGRRAPCCSSSTPAGTCSGSRPTAAASTAATDIGSYAYSLHQTSDGSYVLAGDGDIEQPEVTIEPWIAKVSSSGSLLWQHLYYQVYKPTGLPLSENFSGAAITSAGGFAAAGPTENYTAQKEELYVVQTDSSGNAGTCGDEYAGTPLQAISPELTASHRRCPFRPPTTSAASSPIATTATSISARTDC